MNLNEISETLRFNCQVHPDEPLNLFCDDQKCPQKGLICNLCETENHKHPSSPLKLILKDIHKDLTEFSTGKSLVLMAAQIDLEFSKCLATVEKIKDKQSSNILKQSICHYFKKLKNMMLRPKANEVIGMVAKAKNKSLPLSQFNEFLLSYQNTYRDSKSPLATSNYIFSLSQVIKQLEPRHTDLEKGISNQQKIQTLLQIYISIASSPKIVYNFSSTLKHTSHTIVNSTSLTQNNNYNTNLALIEPSIEGNKSSNMKPKTINIKIVRLTSWISLGLCHQNIVKSAQFYFNTGSIGHGAYVISNDGYTWHNTNSSLNSFYNGWSFEQNDVITIIVNPLSKMIKFHKQNSPDNFYQFAYDIIPGDKLHLCVSLSSHNQSVEIINN